MVVRMLSEEVTWTGEGSGHSEAPESRRALLSALVENLDTALPYLHSCLGKHFMQAAEAAGRNDWQAAGAHSSAVKAALGRGLCRRLQALLRKLTLSLHSGLDSLYQDAIFTLLFAWIGADK